MTTAAAEFDEWATHGPAVWANGGRSYAHLGKMMSAPPNVLTGHLGTIHDVTPAAGALSWIVNVERHAAEHGVALAPRTRAGR